MVSINRRLFMYALSSALNDRRSRRKFMMKVEFKKFRQYSSYINYLDANNLSIYEWVEQFVVGKCCELFRNYLRVRSKTDNRGMFYYY